MHRSPPPRLPGRTLTASAMPPLAEQKPERPDLLRIAVRLIVLVCVLLLASSDALRSWLGQPNRTAALSSFLTVGPATAPLSQMITELVDGVVAGIATVFLTPPVSSLIALVAIGGALAFVVELVVAAGWLVVHRRASARLARTYLHVRPLRPQSRTSSGRGSEPHDLWRAIHAMIPSRLHVALTLHAEPDRPATLGAIIAAGRHEPLPLLSHRSGSAESSEATLPTPPPRVLPMTIRRQGRRPLDPVTSTVTQPFALDGGRDTGRDERRSFARGLEKILLGQDPELAVDIAADPLEAALQPGACVVWQDLGLSLPPHFPIRTPEASGADLLGSLAAALRTPSGVVYTEIQTIAQPRHESLHAAWRVYARRRLIDLRKKAALFVSPETEALDAKLADASFDVSIRLVAVAQDAASRPAAVAALGELRAALGQYHLRAGTGAQQFCAADRTPVHTQIVTEHVPSASRWRIWTALIATVGVFVAAQTTALIPPYLGWPLALSPLIGWLALAGVDQLRRTGLAQVLARAPRIPPPPALLTPFALWRGPMILSAYEASGLWHLPAPTLKTLIDWLPNRRLPAQPHTFIPEGATDRIVLGHARRSDGTEAPVGPSLRGVRQVLHLTAGMGAGKTRALANITQQLIPNGALILDGKGDDRSGSLVATARTYVPIAEEHRLILLDLLDADWPIGLNPLAGIDLSQSGGATQALGTVLSVFSRLDPDAWQKSVGMQQYAQMGTMLVLEGEERPTIANLKQALQDDAYRARLLPRCTNIEVRNFWEVTFPKTGDQQKLSRDALLRRLDNLLVDELTRYLITLPTPTIDIGEAMEDGSLLLFPLPHNTLGELADFVAMLVFQAIVRAAYRRPGTDLSRPTVPLIVDELQVFIGHGDTQDIRDAVTQLRGLGVGGIYAHQSLVQLGELRDELLQNSASRLILRTGEPDASAYARLYPATDLTPADITGQDVNEHQYAIFVGPSGTPEICSLRPLAWPAPVDVVPPPYRGPAWQSVLPRTPARVVGGPVSPLSDRQIVEMVYGPTDIREAAARLARLTPGEWDALMERWNAIRAHQRQHILDNPGCVPDRLERQRWLSRLRAAIPRVFAAALYQRQRWAINPQEQPASVGQHQASSGQHAERAGAQMAGAVISGLAPAAPPPPPAVDISRTREAILDERGRRRPVGEVPHDEYRDLPSEP